MINPLTLDSLAITNVRNLERVSIEPAPRVNVITGNNGQGKTSILEAIYLLATSRSFRTSKLADVVQHDCRQGSVRGQFAEHWSDGPIEREQSVGIEAGRRTVRLNGQSPKSLTVYATRSPVVIFDPRQISLSTGPAAERRTLLDRLIAFAEPEVISLRTRYQRALRERQRLLADRWHQLEHNTELDAYETILAEHGAALTGARRRAFDRLSDKLTAAFSRIAAPEIELAASYCAGGSEDVDQAREQLHSNRRRDARSKMTAYGPHRDDLSLAIDGHAARVVGSQGQHRAITLALKTAELACIAAARELQPILLLDDVSSELDAERTEALFGFLADTDSQIFLTTTRRDLIVTSRAGTGERCDFVVDAGVVSTSS